ncbi:efflux RND transporter periplasmic adaptor subunit [Asticcacaulis excentricus]|uniref:Secretion protein HlyD family protein n=1 Tax=Asticcacaulis excentricus (strain ATCC 15261 / DSM 4724 / KCTC 12464 / NCIMB 9791 / VKM B-1370 / CB 48) TaxID=573065 RepID=E8RKX8_ASTEC|nr:efflux RND transporter periplasmic adaptor subunit [Asticcacaulis excentricus]ADU12538.1 secretion protein HlyD family protein [Asticcacaulis excentricus CB 48]
MRTSYTPNPARKRPSKALLLLLAAPLVLCLGACNPPAPGGKDAKKGEAAAAKPIVSPYAAIANGKADVEGGVIEIAARRAGVVHEVLVQEGDDVKKGQVLARQEADTAQLAVQRARANVVEAQASMRLTEVNLDTAKREYARYQKLAATNFVAGQKLDAQADLIREAEARLAAQQASVQTAQAALAQANFDLEQTYVRAPMDGRIIRRFANPGSGTSTLNVSTMFQLVPAAAERIVRSEIVESSIPDVKPGQEVEIIPETDQTKVYVGTVKRMAATFGSRKLLSDSGNEASDERVVEVVVTADNAPLLIGQRVLVKFMKPGEKAGIKRTPPAPAAPEKK